MKSLLRHAITKLTIASFVFILFIWFFAPYIAIDGDSPLQSFAARLTPTLLLLLAWGSYAIWRLIERHSKQVTAEIDQTILERSAEADNIKERLRTTWAYLKKHTLNTFWQKQSRPWIMLLGPAHSGKTTLLANSGLLLHSPLDETLDKIKPTQLLDLYVSEHAVYVDLGGKYQNYLSEILARIRTQRRHSPINQLLLVIDFPTLAALRENTFEQFINTIASQLKDIRKYHHDLPVLLIITQCDRINGFKEYFGYLGEEDLTKPMGFAISAETKSHQIRQTVETNLKELVKRIGNQLIWRLHHEQNTKKRGLIKEFPIQLEKLSDIIEKCISQLPFSSKTRLEGIYFVSSCQKDPIIDLTIASLPSDISLVPISESHSQLPGRAYFIRDLFHSINSEMIPSTSGRYTWLRVIGFPVAAALIIGLTLFWHYEYQKNLRTLNIVNDNLASLSTPTAANLDIPQLTQLNILKNTIIQLDKAPHEKTWSGLTQANKLKSSAIAAYHNLLENVFQPAILQILTSTIKDGIQNNRLTLYDALKVYMMLNNRQHYDQEVIEYWFAKYWQQRYPSEAVVQQALLQHLSNLLQLKKFNWPLDTKLITQAQNTLKQLPLSELAFLELPGKRQAQEVPILPSGDQLAGIDLSQATIPLFYSPDNFDKIFSVEIPSLVKTLIKGNWVLGEVSPSADQQIQTETLIKQVRALYLNNYSKQWSNAIAKIKLVPATTIPEIQEQIKQLTTPNSQLMQLLKIIVGNATLVNKITNADVSVNDNQQLVYIENYLQQKDNYPNINNYLQNLAKYLAQVTSAQQPTRTAFTLAVGRFNKTTNRFDKTEVQDPITNLLNLANQSPQPFQNWLKTIALSSWQTILVNSRAYLNSVWQATILPEYTSNIENKYPIFPNAKQDISEADFNKFFKPNGAINIFFNSFLEPFIDMSKKYWTWKKLNGLTIGIPQATLDMLIRASMIQQMFYTDNSDHPSLKFTLMPLSLSNDVSSFVLNIAGQLVQQNTTLAKTPSYLAWPRPNSTLINMEFITTAGKNAVITQQGLWAWLRLLDLSLIKTTEKPNIFIVTFQIGNYQAQYRLIADNIVNPYIPGLLTAFRAPKIL